MEPIAENAVNKRGEIKNKLRESFDGKIVRKDLTKKIKEGANVPVYVLEFLLGQYCSSDDESIIEQGVQNVKRILADNFVRPDESQKVLSKLRKKGSYTVIDMITARLDMKRNIYIASFSNLGIDNVLLEDEYPEKFDRLLCGGMQFYQYTENGGKEKAVDHPLYFLLHDEPNPEMTSFVFRETLMTHLLLWGNAYAQIIRNGRGEVIALYPLMADRMYVDRDEKGQLYYEYTLCSDDAPTMKGSVVRLSPYEVLHIPGLGFDGLVGYSSIAMAKNAIGMAMACEEYGAKFFANGAAPSGVLEHPGTIKDPSRVRESWQATFGGSGNANKVAVLEEGMKYTPISISPEQAQFPETRKFQLDEIARIFRVPPLMIGDLEKSSFNNIEQQSLEFVKYTLDPWVSRWEQSMVRSLLSREEKKQYFIKFNVDGLLRGDYQSRMNVYATARQNGWMSANDIRELENLDRIPAEQGGDLYLVNGNMTKLADAGLFGTSRQEAAAGGDDFAAMGKGEEIR